jgi:hypothetical protein
MAFGRFPRNIRAFLAVCLGAVALAAVACVDDGLLENGNFHVDVSGWGLGPFATLDWDEGDAFQQEDSGSAVLTISNLPAVRSGANAFQCVEIEAGRPYVLSGYAWVASDLMREGFPGFRVAFHGNAGCIDEALATRVAMFEDFPANQWKLVAMWTGAAPPGATHAWVGITAWGQAVPQGQPVVDVVSVGWDGVSFAAADDPGSLVIHKLAGGNLQAQFEFMVNGQPQDNQTTTEGVPLEYQLPSGEYRIDEKLAPGFVIREVRCTLDGFDTTYEVTPHALPGFQGVSGVPVLPGRVTECLFTNQPEGPHRAFVPGAARDVP